MSRRSAGSRLSIASRIDGIAAKVCAMASARYSYSRSSVLRW